MLAHAVLEAPQVGIEFAGTFGGESIDDPIALALHFDQPACPQVGQVLRHLDLRLAQRRLEVAHAKRPRQEQMQDPQPRPVAQALVDLHQVHAKQYTYLGI